MQLGCLILFVGLVSALNNGLASTPQMGEYKME